MKNLHTNPKTYYGLGGFSAIISLLINFGNSHCAVPLEDWYGLASALVPMIFVTVGAYLHGKGKAQPSQPADGQSQ